MKKDLFKEFHKAHNKVKINRKNNFITGTSTLIDEKKRITDFVTIRLLPHQVFCCPKLWVNLLANRDALKDEGLNFYGIPGLTCVKKFSLPFNTHTVFHFYFV